MKAIITDIINTPDGALKVGAIFIDSGAIIDKKYITVSISEVASSGVYAASTTAIIAYSDSQVYGITSSDITTANSSTSGAEAFPVGSIFTAVVSTNPSTLLGYGTWSSFGAGKVLVGLDTGDASFDTVEETGGAKTHTLVTSEIPSHTHVQDSHNHTQNAHTHVQSVNSATTGGLSGYGVDTSTNTSSTSGYSTASTTATNQATTATNQNTGGDGSHNNLQPYIVVYMWKRTA